MENKEGVRPLILIGNDDGVRSKGIAALARIAMELGDVVVVAPMTHQSGKSSAVTLMQPLFLRDFGVNEGVRAYAVEGTPADCAKVALDMLLAERRPTLLLSGINHGFNSTISSLYSGTLGYAFEGAMVGVDSVAFSYGDFDPNADFGPCEDVVRDIVKSVLAHGVPDKVVLNVNIPKTADGKLQGVKVASGARGRFSHVFDHRKTPFGRDYWWMSGDFVADSPDDTGTDTYWLERGWATVTPCSVDLTDYGSMQAVEEMLKG